MGDVEVAKEMCRQAKLAGADCIKFQHHLPDEEMLSDAVIAGKIIFRCMSFEAACTYT